MKTGTVRNKGGFTMIEIMIVVGLVGMLAVIAIPSYVRARYRSQVSTCLNNLRQIDGAKAQYAIEAHVTTGTSIQDDDLDVYLKTPMDEIQEPADGDYTVNDVGVQPECSIGDEHVL